ncbi:MAG: DNA/RNA non-specific endonuclease [Candidatus Woesearchaeota archaeon]
MINFKDSFKNRRSNMQAFVIFVLSLLISIFSPYVYAENIIYPEIHCKHFFYGYPTGTPATNDLIIRDIYALSSNDETKLADWVAYRLDEETISGSPKKDRDFKKDPWLDDRETLEPDDYKSANKSLKVQKGHQAPLASFKGTKYWRDTNYLSNITPQKTDLNQVPWKVLEDKERKMVEKYKVVYVITGTLYEKEMEPLPNADEPHKVPSGYWKIIIIQTTKKPDSIKTASFIFDQETPKKDKIISHLTTINEIEKRSGLDFLRELSDDIEEQIESSKNQEWAVVNFN